MTVLNTTGRRLADELELARNSDAERQRLLATSEKINIVGAGGSLTAAYEQLRNAAENTEEHLLTQSAIRRFYKQLFITRDENLIRSSGSELAVELTFAGYIPNDSLTKNDVSVISKLATEHYQNYELLLKQRSLSPDKILGWVLDSLSVNIALMLGQQANDIAFANFAYSYIQSIIPFDSVSVKGDDKDEYGAALFVAMHKALLKSNVAVIRTLLMRRYDIKVTDGEGYIAFNQRIDKLVVSGLTERLFRVVDRNGAPLRILRKMIQDQPEFSSWLSRREVMLEKFEQQVNREYSQIGQRINRAIVRSVIFLIITKFLIGIAIEVPYDFWAHGQILWLPLIINLLFPPIYMIALRLTHKLPGYANTTALVDRVDSMFYGERPILVKRQNVGKRYAAAFSIAYAVFSICIFAAVVWGLLMLNFSFVHIAIFFVFVSAASFLGFRLSRLIRELEVVRSSSNGLTFIRDIIYLPFVTVGRWMSEKYSQVNIVAMILDMLIELPLKTVLRLIRQWGAFIDDRKDRI